MSFFIKGKKNVNTSKLKGKKRKISAKPKKKFTNNDDNESIPSEDEEEIDRKQMKFDESSSEDENETAQEKKLRLAKLYLKEIAKEEKQRLEDNEIEDETIDNQVVSKRLREEYLKKAGKFRVTVADQYKDANLSEIISLKCKEHHQPITCLCLSTDHIFSGSKDGSIVKWSLKDLCKIASLPFKKLNSVNNKILGHNKAIMSIAVSYDNKFLAVGDETDKIQIWNPTDLSHIKTLKGHRGAVTGLVFRQNTHTLYSCSKDRSVKIWSLDEMSYVETLYGHQDMVTSIDALSRERAVTSGGRDISIRIWKIAEESQLVYNGDYGSIDIVRLINEENFISGGDDGSLCIWSALKKKPLCVEKEAHGRDPITSLPNWICSVACFLNSDLIASGSCNGTIKLWKISDNFRSISLLTSIEVPGFINCLSFTSDGKKLIAGVGGESKFGRWTVIKQIKSRIIVIPLLQST